MSEESMRSAEKPASPLTDAQALAPLIARILGDVVLGLHAKPREFVRLLVGQRTAGPQPVL
jgi:hypothetical protein